MTGRRDMHSAKTRALISQKMLGGVTRPSDAEIVAYVKAGHSQAEAAAWAGICRSRVGQILPADMRLRRGVAVTDYFDWSPAVISDLRRRWDAGETTAAIARALGCSKGAVVGKVDRLGLSERPGTIKPIPAPKREAIVLAFKAGASRPQIYERFGVGKKAVCGILREAGLGDSKTQFDFSRARELRAEGLTWREIGETMGVPLGTARYWVMKADKAA